MHLRVFSLIAAALIAAASFEAEAKSAPKKSAAKASVTHKVPAKKSAGKPAGPVQSAHRRSPYVGAISADAKTGKVLFADHADAEAYPASVTKLMTLLLVLEDVKAGRYSLDKQVVATPEVYSSEPSWVGIKVGETMSVGDMCMALMVESANDVAIALGVNSAGSLSGFIARMNGRAQELGMTRTKYFNPNGLPPKPKYPWKGQNVTTAADQLKLARALLAIPGALEFTNVKTCDLVRTKNGYRTSVTRRVGRPNRTTELNPGESVVKQMTNHNNVMVKDKLKVHNPDGSEAVDGLKTGYIDAGGSSVVVTASRKGGRAIVIVLGSSTSKERDAEASKLINDALSAVAW